ncbi:MAG: hypothetical protein HY291_18775 [Planctomycetes bacterium]|nr:hypothetical protein [Planctomycetota bacterium]
MAQSYPAARILFTLSVLALLSILTGCGTAKLTPPNEVIEPVIRVNELPWRLKAKDPPKEGAEAAPWHDELSVELDVLPGDAAGLKDAIDQHRGPAYQAAQALIKEIQGGVEKSRKADTRWSILAIQVGGAKAQRNSIPTVTAELGLTKLYARRPEIGFENVTLEQAMLQLAQQAGLKFASPRSVNPVLSWRKENVSVIEAVDAILNLHGYGRKITGSYVQLALAPGQFKTRQEFVDGAVQSILNYGTGLDRNVAALMPMVRVKPAETEKKDDKDKEKKKTDEPEPGPSAPAPKPPPPDLSEPPK